MRLLVAALALGSLTLGNPLSAQPLPAPARAALADTIRREANRFLVELGSLDFNRVMALFATDPDFRYADNGRIYPTRQALADAGGGFMKRTKRLGGRWRTADVIVLGPDAATFLGVFEADGADLQGKPIWTSGKIWTFVYQRRGGRWLIVQAHETDGR